MSTLSYYSFKDDANKRCIDYIASAQEAFPRDHARKLRVFLNHAGILTENDPQFTADVETLSRHSYVGIEDEKADDKTVYLVVKCDELMENDEETLLRFQKGAAPFLHHTRTIDEKAFNRHIRLATLES